jgi:hypothetical protein
MGLYPSSFWIWKQEDGELLNTDQTDIPVADKLDHDSELTTTDPASRLSPVLLQVNIVLLTQLSIGLFVHNVGPLKQ